MKKIYRPVSILSSLPKIFEKIIYNDISKYMEDKLSPYLCGFRKGFSTQYCMVIMLEIWKKALDNKNIAGALLTDMSKAFDSLNRELLIAKLDTYGFNHNSLTVILNYLSGRKQRTKINNSFSKWSLLTRGVPQGSILDLLLFDVYMNDVFYFTEGDGLTNYADDTIPYAV